MNNTFVFPVEKFSSKESFHRKLTDKDKEEAEGQPTASRESTVATCSSIAKGNATLMPVFKSATANNDNGGATAAAAAKTSSMSTAVHAMETETETGSCLD